MFCGPQAGLVTDGLGQPEHLNRGWFGGYEQSGNGSESEFLEVKAIIAYAIT
jgi:hypothetical protein